MTSYFQFVLRHRAMALVVCFLLTILSLASISRAVIATSIGKLFLGESPAYKEYLKRAEAFGNDEILIVGLDIPDILHPDKQARLRAAVERIEAIPSVARVESALSAQNLRLEEETLHVERYADEAASEPDRVAGLVEAMAEDPLTEGLIISSSGKQTAVIVELKTDPGRPVEEGPRIVREVLLIFEQEGFPQAELHRSGLLAILSEVLVETRYNLTRIFPFVIAILFFTVWILFRRLWPGLISVALSLLAVTWTFGLAVQLDRHVDILLSMVPAVIFIVSFSDIVHLCSAYLIELQHGVEKQEAILRSAEDVGRACVYTSVTTFVGFLSLSLVPVPVFRKTGLILGFGVAIALLQAVTLVPIIFSFMKEPAPLRQGATSFVHEGLDFALERVQNLTTRRPRAVIIVFALLSAISLVGAFRLRIETDFMRRLGETNPVREDHAWFQEHFSGTTTIDIYLEAPRPDGLLDAGLLERINDYQETLEQAPDVDKGVSLADLIKRIHQTINAGEIDVRPFPATREAVAQYLLLFEMGGGEDLERLIDFERQTMRILLRVKEGGFRMAAATGARAVSLAEEMLGGAVSVEPTGLTYLLGDWLDEVLAGQKRGILVSLLTVTFMMALAVRSLKVGLWAMVPNALPLLFLAGYVGGLWDQVDSDTLMIFYVADGIAVDDTIHFLTRYRIEEARCANTESAIRRTYYYTGRAIIMTAIILVAGFLPFALSDYFTIHILGTLLPMCLLTALLTDLFLLPAMVQMGWVSFRKAGLPSETPAVVS
jgi:hypothetical protein